MFKKKSTAAGELGLNSISFQKSERRRKRHLRVQKNHLKFSKSHGILMNDERRRERVAPLFHQPKSCSTLDPLFVSKKTTKRGAHAGIKNDEEPTIHKKCEYQ